MSEEDQMKKQWKPTVSPHIKLESEWLIKDTRYLFRERLIKDALYLFRDGHFEFENKL